MSNKDTMLKGLADLKKIIEEAKKTKPKSPIDIRDRKGIEKAIKEISGMEMGGEVMDMTKSQPVSMMDEGGQAISDADRDKVKKLLKEKDNKGGSPFIMPGQKKLMNKVLGKGKPMEAAMGGPVKKMNMGGVVPGRGGSFKGVK
jgi:hypothetical protein